jgi:hypothetical protein
MYPYMINARSDTKDAHDNPKEVFSEVFAVELRRMPPVRYIPVDTRAGVQQNT